MASLAVKRSKIWCLQFEDEYGNAYILTKTGKVLDMYSCDETNPDHDYKQLSYDEAVELRDTLDCPKGAKSGKWVLIEY